jgi:hypothetical protein
MTNGDPSNRRYSVVFHIFVSTAPISPKSRTWLAFRKNPARLGCGHSTARSLTPPVHLPSRLPSTASPISASCSLSLVSSRLRLSPMWEQPVLRLRGHPSHCRVRVLSSESSLALWHPLPTKDTLQPPPSSGSFPDPRGGHTSPTEHICGVFLPTHV